MRQKIIGASVAIVLVSLAVVGAFASQDGVSLLAGPTTTPTGTTVASDARGGPTNTPEPTDTPAPTNTPGGPTNTPEPTDTPAPTNTPGGPTNTPEPTNTQAADTPTPEPSAIASPCAADDDAEDESDDDGGSGSTGASDSCDSDGGEHGIPDANPSHHPEDGDGTCEHGETVTQTTPSGNSVNVPCETQKHGSDHGNSGQGHGGGGN